jgi:hypothetical protein
LGIWQSYKLRLERKKWRIRALRKQRELHLKVDRTANIREGSVLLFCTLRNEKIRLPYLLQYYRDLGIDHFIFVDNGSDDGSTDYLSGQEDVSLWHTSASYKRSRFGMDWINWLLRRYGHGHWCLSVDPDEFFVFPFCDKRPIQALTDWLDASSVKSFSAMLLDMYPKGPIDEQPYREGQDPLEIATWFDSGNYVVEKNTTYQNLWIQGGPRARVFFRDDPLRAPALNKIPLVKWDRRYVYVSSTHMLLPRGLNNVYDEWGGEKASGILLHTKFLNTFPQKAKEELERKQHYSSGQEYKAYADTLKERSNLWCEHSERYVGWRQLEVLGLISKGNWV